MPSTPPVHSLVSLPGSAFRGARAVPAIALAGLLLSLAAPTPASEISVMHGWSGAGARAGMAPIRQHLQSRGLPWQEEALPSRAKLAETLEARVQAGQPPAAVQLSGWDVQTWAQRGQLEPLDELATPQEWSEVVPVELQRLSKWRGQWVAAPLTVHSTNWLWVNKALAERLDITEPPDSWHDLLYMLDKARAQGITPLALGPAAWEQAVLFESVAAGTGGAEFYRKAFIDMDPNALSSPMLHKVFTRMRQLSGYLNPAPRLRRGEPASDLVSSGQALLQVQGSWTGGDFTAKGLVPGRHYHCWRFPDTQGVYLFHAEQFVFFKQAAPQREPQRALASGLMEPALQASVNMLSGAAPARLDVRSGTFNECGQRNLADLRRANLRRTVLGSIALGSAHPPEVRVALTAIVAQHLQGKMETDAAVAAVHQLLVRHTAMQTRSH